MERLVQIGQTACLRFTPWENIPQILQGVTLKGSRGAQEETFDLLSDRMRRAGFKVIQRLKQVHGARVVPIKPDSSEGAGRVSLISPLEADGLVSCEEDTLGVITMADCVPLYLLDRNLHAWGLIHAGWRGVAAGVMSEGLRVMNESFGTPADGVEIYLGPSICGSCYQVGPEVAALLEPGDYTLQDRPPKEKIFVDLRRLLADQARSHGVPAANIFTSRFCTRCHNDLFYSYRAEGEPALGQMWGFMGKLGKK
ncbi:MAG TPA: polyphenol oxidase family protein [archaeon]|nr:polyphenol oxidase family protein [archaeon]